MLAKTAQHIALFVLAVVFAGVISAYAETRLPQQQEERAQALFYHLRCVVCQNQSIGDSDADVARDLRIIVREQIASGKTDLEIKDFLVARYGEFILLRPPLRLGTLLLWLTPLFALAGGLTWMQIAWRRRNRFRVVPGTAPLSDDERKALEKVLEGR